MFEPTHSASRHARTKSEKFRLYVPRGARRIPILHDQLGILRNYFYPTSLKKGTVYEMVLNNRRQRRQARCRKTTCSSSYCVPNLPTPTCVDDAMNKCLSKTDSSLQPCPKGEHTYRVEAPHVSTGCESLHWGRTGNQECQLETQVRLVRRNLLTARTRVQTFTSTASLVGKTPLPSSDRIATMANTGTHREAKLTLPPSTPYRLERPAAVKWYVPPSNMESTIA